MIQKNKNSSQEVLLMEMLTALKKNKKRFFVFLSLFFLAAIFLTYPQIKKIRLEKVLLIKNSEALLDGNYIHQLRQQFLSDPFLISPLVKKIKTRKGLYEVRGKIFNIKIYDHGAVPIDADRQSDVYHMVFYVDIDDRQLGTEVLNLWVEEANKVIQKMNRKNQKSIVDRQRRIDQHFELINEVNGLYDKSSARAVFIGNFIWNIHHAVQERVQITQESIAKKKEKGNADTAFDEGKEYAYKDLLGSFENQFNKIRGGYEEFQPLNDQILLLRQKILQAEILDSIQETVSEKDNIKQLIVVNFLLSLNLTIIFMAVVYFVKRLFLDGPQQV